MLTVFGFGAFVRLCVHVCLHFICLCVHPAGRVCVPMSLCASLCPECMALHVPSGHTKQ